MTLRLLEHYPSVQGEGPRTGIPTQFVRFAGCNLRCPRWPCDTQFAIQPQLYRKEQKTVTVQHLYTDIIDMAQHTGARHICLTGGEPLLQPRKDIDQLIHALTAEGLFVEMFSNGTLPYSPYVIEKCHVVMDWKLPGSGEDRKNPTRVMNFKLMRPYLWHTIKFTCKDKQDLETARAIFEQYDMRAFGGSIYVGPVWDTELPPREIVEFIMDHQLPWRLNLQIHKYVWPPDARRT